jgi:hypothetical protein
MQNPFDRTKFFLTNSAPITFQILNVECLVEFLFFANNFVKDNQFLRYKTKDRQILFLDFEIRPFFFCLGDNQIFHSKH